MTTPHTPGPWTRSWPIPADDTISRQIWSGVDLIADVFDLEGASAEAAANARLISAAPELLAALQWAVARVQVLNDEGNPVLSAWLPEARAAIASATGEGQQ